MDSKRLLAALDTDWWLYLRVVADALDEEGRGVEARGFRWLAELKKFPAGDRHRWFWMFPRTTPGYPSRYEAANPPDMPGSASARLPELAVRSVRGMFPEIGCQPGEFRSLELAYLAAACAAGRWLGEKGEKGE